MKLFLKKRPNIVSEGRIYIAVPPLYGLPLGKNKFRYFKDRFEYVKYVEDSFIKKVDIRYSDGRPVNQIDLVDILYANEGYVEAMDKLSYTTDPTFLEFVLRYHNTKNFESRLKKEYRFTEDIEISGDTTIIRSLVNQRVQTVFLNNRFFSMCSEVLPYIEKGYNRFKVDGKPTGLYGLMKAFKDFSPVVIRYKGLGEMNEDQLAESTLYPTNKRLLIQYNSQNLSDDIDQIRYLESHKQELLSVLNSDDE